MRQRKQMHLGMESSRQPIVSFEGLARFSAEMRKQRPQGPPPGKRKAHRQAAYESPPTSGEDIVEEPAHEEAIDIRPSPPRATPAPPPALAITPPPARPISSRLLDRLPSEAGAASGGKPTLDELYAMYEPAPRQRRERLPRAENGLVSRFAGDVALQSCSVVFTMVPTSLWRRALWAWKLDKWPVDVYIEFCGKPVEQGSADLHFCFTLDAARGVPRMTAYTDRAMMPNAAGAAASKCYFPLDCGPFIQDLFRYCQEASSETSTRYAYADRCEAFFSSYVPCCGEALAALALAWAPARRPLVACPDSACMPVVSAGTGRAFGETGGEVWAAHRLVYSVLWVVLFERYADFCGRYGLTHAPPASTHALFAKFFDMHAQGTT